ncbi:MAG: UDP-N-acetylmuramate--L-alanine ligase [Saprospiraceae bacterium]|nr:MAG: UDP-N-acetylmuramate--L-alanine ligase [Saprospiraceae bacterium]
MNLSDIRLIYFIGIGGIGMSALARYFNSRGVVVHGYDKTESPLTRTLAAEGMQIHYDEDISKIPQGVDLVVYTPAVPVEHAELLYFRKHGFPIKKRAEVLGIISRGMKTIAVSGTHGKTTTTTVTTHLLREGGVNCSAFLGGIARNFASNFVEGTSDWVVVEADEYDRSFLHLSPDIAILLSMDADHLDIYGDREQMLETGFKAFVRKIKDGGKLVLRQDLLPEFSDLKGLFPFGLEQGQYRAANIRVENGFFTFDYQSPKTEIKALQFSLPGRHNVENATAAITVALQLGVSPEDIRKALLSFRGIQRRFETIYRDDKVVYIDDYAHHPSELKAAINAARELFPDRKITGIFQPHLFSRTRDFAAGFAAALDALDEIILLEIYPARELPIPGVNSEMLINLMQNPNSEVWKKSDLMDRLQHKNIDVLLTLGAGDIDRFVEPIGQWLEESN